MQTRLIHTRFWRDGYITQLTTKERLFFLYLVVNEHINLSGMYELPELVMAMESGLGKEDIKRIKKKFIDDGKFYFFKSWVRVMNVDKYQQFTGSKNEVAKQKEMALCPQELIGYRWGISDSVIPLVISNKKSVISNQKKGSEEGKQNKTEEVARAFLQRWNEVHGTKYTAWQPILNNLIYWLTVYGPTDIMQAVFNLKSDDFWRLKMTPVMMLRRKNPRGEDVDYIGDLIHNVRELKSKEQRNKIIT